MIKTRFFLHLGFFIAFLAIVIPLIVSVTVPAFQNNAQYTNATCTVVGKAQDTQISASVLYSRARLTV